MDWVEVLRPAELGSDLAVLAGPQAVAEGGENWENILFNFTDCFTIWFYLEGLRLA